MQRTGIAKLPLHYGRAPLHLVVRMQKLAWEIANIMVDEYGPDKFLKRVSDPFGFKLWAVSWAMTGTHLA